MVFLSGCPLRCAYCHNPDTWARPPAFEMEASEVLARALRYRSYWRSEGGITVSGGEPLTQLDFLIDLFTRAKAQGVSTCIDTSAAPFTREGEWFVKFERLMESTDLLLLDIKAFDPGLHKALTGKDNANILDCARYLSDIGKPVWIRHVFVPDLARLLGSDRVELESDGVVPQSAPNKTQSAPNKTLTDPNQALSDPNQTLSDPNTALTDPNPALTDPNKTLNDPNKTLTAPNPTLNDSNSVANFAKSLKNVKRVDVLPYHVFGVEKWKALGLPYRLAAAEPPSKEATDRIRALFT